MITSFGVTLPKMTERFPWPVTSTHQVPSSRLPARKTQESRCKRPVFVEWAIAEGKLVAKMEGKEIKMAMMDKLFTWRVRLLLTRPVDGLKKWRNMP